jgi:hypothetical protein
MPTTAVNGSFGKWMLVWFGVIGSYQSCEGKNDMIDKCITLLSNTVIIEGDRDGNDDDDGGGDNNEDIIWNTYRLQLPTKLKEIDSVWSSEQIYEIKQALSFQDDPTALQDRYLIVNVSHITMESEMMETVLRVSDEGQNIENRPLWMWLQHHCVYLLPLKVPVLLYKYRYSIIFDAIQSL